MTGNFVLVLLAVFLLVRNVPAQNNINTDKEAIKQADIDFSDYSKAHGFKDAFLKYAADDGVILMDNSYPVEGIEKIRELFKTDDGGYTLVWTPAFTEISKSGELGYTYGTYEESSADETGKTKKSKGTYVTIWKKDNYGNWKFVLDTGHKGLEPQKK